MEISDSQVSTVFVLLWRAIGHGLCMLMDLSWLNVMWNVKFNHKSTNFWLRLRRTCLYCTVGQWTPWQLARCKIGQHALITRVRCIWHSSSQHTLQPPGCWPSELAGVCWPALLASTHRPVTSSLGQALQWPSALQFKRQFQVSLLVWTAYIVTRWHWPALT